METREDVFDTFKALLDGLTVEEFRRRLAVTELLYAYVIKQFVEKYPGEAKAWLEEGDEKDAG